MDRQLIEEFVACGPRLRQAVAGLTPDELTARPGPGDWSILELVIHLADSDSLAIDRMKRMLIEDDPPLLYADETAYVRHLAPHEQSLEDALSLFELGRRQFARVLRALPEDAFDRRGTHNRRGVLTVGGSVIDYIEHVEHHLKFLAEKRSRLGKPLDLPAGGRGPGIGPVPERPELDPLTRLRRELAYNAWANRECLRSVLTAQAVPDRAAAVLAHIVGAEWMWLRRLGQVGPEIDVWPDLSPAQSDGHFNELSTLWRSYLRGLTREALPAEVSYTNSKGERWANTVVDILTHVVLHSSYHRGQVATLLGRAGEAAAYSDYIECVRRGHLEREWPDPSSGEEFE